MPKGAAWKFVVVEHLLFEDEKIVERLIVAKYTDTMTSASNVKIIWIIWIQLERFFDVFATLEAGLLAKDPVAVEEFEQVWGNKFRGWQFPGNGAVPAPEESALRDALNVSRHSSEGKLT